MHKEKQIMIFAMALVLAWLLISCVARCILCTSLNHSESQFTHLQNVHINTPIPFTLTSNRR